MVFSEIKESLSNHNFENAIMLIDNIEEKHQLEAKIYKSVVYVRKGDFGKGLKIANESIKLAKKKKNKTLEIAARVAKTNALNKIDNYEIGLTFALETEKIYNKLQARGKTKLLEWIGHLYNLIGIFYDYKGDFDLALLYYKQGLEKREQLDDQSGVAKSLNNIGEIYRIKGELDLSLDYYLQSLNHFVLTENQINLAMVYSNIGALYNQKGNTDLGLDYLRKALRMLENHEDNLVLAEIYYKFIVLSLDINQHKEAVNYYKQLCSISVKDENKFVIAFKQIAQALILKNTNRTKTKAQAQEIFEEIINQEILMVELTVFALLNLCEMLLNELKLYGDEDILIELHEYSNRLLEIATEQSSSLIQVEAYIIQSRISLLELDIDKARKLLTQAQLISEVKGLQKLAIRISVDHDALLSSIDRWNKLIEDEAPFEDRLELADFEDIMKKLVRKKIDIPEIVEETPLLFLILDEAGNSKYTKRFSQSRAINETLVGVFLTAIISFTKTAFSSNEPVERINHQDYTIILKSTHSYVFCYVFKGPSYYAVQKIDKMLEIVKDSPKILKLFEDFRFQTIPEEDPIIQNMMTQVFTNHK
ncbi:MAG: Photosystem I assembly protein Ycf3 [Candidatus Heimdallarchaeota archaeon LC_2]|nr:MAG: Photosystem I assembly protein Ycf3 [Candidatus Heimdallarchaeota archaeon LC_2]